MARLQISLLGPFQATLDGQPIRGFDSDKARALLAYLAMEAGRTHSREALADLLWPEYAPAAARANLRNTLSNLRALLRSRETPAPFLQITTDSLSLSISDDCQVDARQFEALMSGERSIERLEQAVALYRGDLLAGFALKDSTPFEDWLLLARERLRRQYREALRQLAAGHEERGERELALAAARRWVEADPWDEVAQREVMRLLALGGQRNAALAQYERCKQALADELGVEPEAATMQLYQEIRDGGLPPAESAPRPRSLPAPLLPLIGREREVAELAAMLRDPQCRLLTILGPGGMGKTRLAIEFASRLKGEFGEVAFTPCSGITGADGLAPAIAQALGLAFRAATASPREELLDYLRGKRRLLILDSFEHLLEGAPLLSELLEAAPQVKLLVTSRARLGLQGEQLFRLDGLALTPQALTPSPSPKGGGESAVPPLPLGEGRGEGFSEGHPAIELFLLGARRVRPEFAPNAADLAEIARICRLVEGLPLAILLAASWMELLSPAEIAAQIERECFAFLEADWRDIPERHRSMRAVLDHSWRLLAPREQEALAALSVFRSGFALEAAQAVAGTTMRDLLRLLDRSLVHRREAGRYDLHDLLRQYTGRRLAESADREEKVQDRCAAYYIQAMGRWEAELWSAHEMAALREMGAESDNLRAAWNYAVAKARLRWLSQAANGLGEYLSRQGRCADGAAIFAQAASALQEATLDGESRKVLAILRGWQGRFYLEMAQIGLARQQLREALDLLDAAATAGAEVRRERARIARRLGNALGMQSASQGGGPLYFGAPLAAQSQEQALYRQSLSLAQEAGDRVEMAGALKDLTALAVRQGRFEEARRLQSEALSLLRQLGAPGPLFLEMVTPATVLAIDQGRFADAEQLVDETAAVMRELKDPALTPWVLDALANGLFLLGRLEEAQPLYEQSVALFDKAGLPSELARELMVLGRNLMLMGRYQEARDQLQRSLALSETLGYRENALECCFRLGFVAMGEWDLAVAEEWLHRCLTDHPRPDEEYPHYVLWLRAYVSWERGRAHEARRDLREMTRRHMAQNMSAAVASGVVPLFGRILVQQGQVERAAELYALSKRRPLVANSRWFGDVGWRHVAEALATLPPEALAAAEERGRAREWRAAAEELLAELDR